MIAPIILGGMIIILGFMLGLSYHLLKIKDKQIKELEQRLNALEDRIKKNQRDFDNLQKEAEDIHKMADRLRTEEESRVKDHMRILQSYNNDLNIVQADRERLLKEVRLLQERLKLLESCCKE